jgi:hypothetical protein
LSSVAILLRIVASVYLLNMRLYFHMTKKAFLSSIYYVIIWTLLYIVLIIIFSHPQIKKEFI